MNDRDALAERFEAHRAHLEKVAYRMLGSHSEAEDAVQEAWLRCSRAGSEADNLGGWLTTVVSRVCLDMLRRRKSRREDELSDDSDARDDSPLTPENEAILADSVGTALLMMLDALSPAERVAFVLHDMFDLPFEDIALILDRSPEATRQLASRARRRVRVSAGPGTSEVARRQAIVDAFLSASRKGDLQALLSLLDPNIVMRADAAGIRMGSPSQLLGAEAVAQQFAGRARAAQPALVDGRPGLVWMHQGTPRVVFDFRIEAGAVVSIELIADPERIASMQLA